ncbi:hypothetical protein BOX15_Mlig017840g3 [Macrostomum lignano]|uniref:Uncharacterized protein n=1 Tax=Macrostomum lignano TaxID=282301 RepID=A0A267GCG9_9PLAT|nr:hypothetical protein BOX15_Mlig017840g3 [Macrostomum lignano]
MDTDNRAGLSEHRSKHRRRQAYQDYDRRLAAKAKALNDKREVVNKIASIDIWATERLYKKWQRQAIAGARHKSAHCPDRDPSMFNYSAKQQPACETRRNRDFGSASRKYFAASMTKQVNNKKIRTATMVDFFDSSLAGDAPLPSHLHRCQNRRRAHSRPNESGLDQEHLKHRKHQHYHEHRHSRRNLSLSNTMQQHSRCQWAKVKCQQQQQQQQKQKKVDCQSERTSEIDWPESWPSIWGSTAPQCAQRGSSNSDCLQEATAATDSRKLEQRSKEKKNLRRRQQSGSLVDAVAGKDTFEALLTLDINEKAGEKQVEQQLAGREENGAGSQNLTMPHLKNSQIQGSENQGSTVLNKTNLEETVRPQVNVASYCNSLGKKALGNEFNVVRLIKPEKCRYEQATNLPKPVVWLIADEPSATEQEVRSDDDRANFNNEVQFREATDNGQAFNTANNLKTVTSSTISFQQQQGFGLRTFTSITCHNSADSKTLKMLSSATNEREEEEEEIQSHISSPIVIAQISYIKSAVYWRTGAIKPEIRMHSNREFNNLLDSDDASEDGDGIIYTAQEVGESKFMEPQTGIVTRLVQVEVLKAAQLIKSKGFAGLVGTRPSELDADMQSTTDTLASTTIDNDEDYDIGDDFLTEGDKDSLGELDDLDLDDEEYEEAPIRSSKVKPSADTASSSTSSSSDETDSRRSQRGRRLGRRSSSATSKGDYSRQKRLPNAAAAAPEARALPMTQCPTTRHRIECFTTRSGQVKCYMTARHPVKCRIQDGRIVCKATVRAESSNLPYPCNAAWQ